MGGDAIIVEGPTLETCRLEGARRLRVDPGHLRLEILQRGTTGIFSSKPFRVRISERPSSPKEEAGDGFLAKLNAHLDIAAGELTKLQLLDKKQEAAIFESCVEDYENLSDERRKEIQEISALLSGPMAQKVQERIARDGSFLVQIAEDKLSCTMTVTPAECFGKPVKLQEVLPRLREIGVNQGLDHVEIRRLLELVQEKGRPIVDAVIAKGILPVAGKDGAIEYHAQPAKKEEVVRGDGSVDHHGEARVTVVKKDQVLARLMPPTSGTAGVNVLGEPIPAAAGKAAVAVAGFNVVASPHPEHLGEIVFSAEIDGLLDVVQNTLNVRPVFVVRGDVDMTTGNIRFEGKVHITGSVRDGFAVHAAGDIEVGGTLEGCVVVSEKGNVIIRKGIAGRHRCFVSAGQDVEAKYIENARVYAQGIITVLGSIMHSDVVAGDTVQVIQGRGAIIGGTTKAGRLVNAKRLGAAGSPPTEVIVGISIEQQNEIRDLDQRSTSLQNAALHLAEAIRGFVHKHQDLAKLSRPEKQELADLKLKLLALHHHMDLAANRRREILHRIQVEARGCVQVSAEVFDHVAIRIGDLVEVVKNHLSSVAFHADAKDGRIVQGAFGA